MLIYGAMKETFMLNLLLFFSFCSLLIKADWININSFVSGTLSGTGDINSYNVMLSASGKYTFTAMGSGGLNPSLSLLNTNTGTGPGNDDWGGSTYVLDAQFSMSALGGFYIISVKSEAGAGTYKLYLTDTTPCSTSCIICQSLPAQCPICPNGKACNSCPAGQNIFGAYCLSTCPAWFSPVSGSCYACSSYDDNCNSCSGTTCLGCSGTNLVYGTGCVASCPSGTFANNGVCTSCSAVTSSCTTCSSSTMCLSCSGGLFANGQTCVNPCPSGTYSDGTACQACTTLNGNCATCNSSSTCLTCTGTYLALGKTCVNSCPVGTYKNNKICTSCLTLDNFCTSCNGSLTCTGCSSGKFALGSTCVDNCPSGTFKNGGICTSCVTLDNSCTTCNSTTTCTSCSGNLLALGKTCTSSCPSGTYKNNGICTSCLTLDNFCTSCNGSLTCTGCSSGKLALGSTCVDNCPSGTFKNGGICTSCATLDSDCLTCNSSISCTSCDYSQYALGSSCVASCPANTYNNAGICTACTTLDNSCISCNSSLTCQACSGGLLALGATCATSCPLGTYSNAVQCLSCMTLDPYCEKCSNEKSCSFCGGGRLIYGSTCVFSCPKGTSNNGGICTTDALKITLVNTNSADTYLVQFPAVLTTDIQVPVVSKITLVGVDPSTYNYTLTKQSSTIYQITFKYTKTIPSATLRIVYTLNGVPTTSNNLIGQFTAQIPSKYMAYMSEGDKATTETVTKAAESTITGAATGASSVAIFGGNPALLWPLLNLFQTFYYLIFIDVNYPANVQVFLKVFSLGSLGFLPNPLEWFVKDIDAYDLPVPKRYNDYNFSGLFLGNAGNEMLLLVLVFGLYLISKATRRWIRRSPTTIRLATNKTVEWFEWSGILRSLITSYTDIAQAVFLQMKVLTFYSTVFTLSALFAFLALGFIVIFPVLIWIIVRRFRDHPELLLIKYETIVKEYNIKKEASRNFIAIWLIRRLIMCLSLVFLQGYPYVQINVLCVLMAASIFYTWVYAPYTTKKENICNTLMELLFGLIHAVIYVLIYDDHNPYFSEEQRLQMGWIIIFTCGVILLISLGLNLLDQVRAVIQGIKLVKKLMSKKDKKRIKRKLDLEDKRAKQNNTSGLQLLDPNKMVALDASFNASFPSTGVSESNRLIALPVPPSRNVVHLRKIRRAQLAHRIRELRQINGS